MAESSVTIDPRRHDAVLLAAGDVATDWGLPERLRAAGVPTVPVPTDPTGAPGPLAGAPGPLAGPAERAGVRPGRAAVLVDSPGLADAARRAGFALVIGLADGGTGDGATAGEIAGADVTVAGPDQIAVRTGDRRMSQLPNAIGAAEFTGADPGRRPAVFFDFDGTLSQIVADPAAARLVDGAAEALRALAAHVPVAVLSGRDLADVRERVGLPGLWYAGSHGFELIAPDGTAHRNDDAVAAVPVLADAADTLRARLAGLAGVAVEHKRYAVAVHYRNAARADVPAVLAAVRTAGRERGLRVTTGREVIELRPDLDWDKGRTLRWILQRLPASGPQRWWPVFLGDDITDEDAFDAVRSPDLAGAGIVVRHRDDGDRATAAGFALEDPDQAAEFTRRLAEQVGTSAPTPAPPPTDRM